MKKIYLYIYYFILLVIIIMLVIKLFEYQKIIKQYHSSSTNEIILQETIQKIPIFEAYQIRDSILSKEIENKIILLFPCDICDVCFQSIFQALSVTDPIIKKDVTAIVSNKFARNYKIYDTKYNLRLGNVVYSNSLEDLSKQIDNHILIFYFNDKQQVMAPLLINQTTIFFTEYLKKMHASFIKNPL